MIGRVVAHYVTCACCDGRGRHDRNEDPIACGARRCMWCLGTGKAKEIYRIPSGTRALEAFRDTHAEASSVGRA